MRRAVIATALVLGATALVGPGAYAGDPDVRDTPGCVTKAEWQSFSVFAGGSGGTKKKANRVFDTDGVRVAGETFPQQNFRYQVRRYEKCKPGAKTRYRVDYNSYRDRPSQPWGPWWSYWG